MTLTCRDIIKRAYRKLGSLASGADPTPEEMTDGMTALTGLQRILHGNVIGPRLSPQSMTNSLQAENGGLYQLALANASTLTAPANPKGGSRFGIVDAAANLATFALTVGRNGRLLEGAPNDLNLAVNGTQRIWFFDPDSGNWVREADLASLDVSPPYPDRLIDFLPDMLAVFVSAEIDDNAITQDVVSLASEGIQAFARIYGRRGKNQLDPPAGFNIAGMAGSQG